MGVAEKKKPKITLYEHVNFKGRSKTFTEANDNLIDEGFNDYSSSVIVEGGVWVLYQHCNYTGNVCVVMEGDRTNLLDCRGDKGTKIHDFNDVVSSLKPLNYDFTEEPKCTVYVHGFEGRSLQFTDDILDLGWYKMSNQISSIRVHSGAWVGYDMVNFHGTHSLYLKGDHIMSSTEGGFRNDQLCSLRALQITDTVPLIVDKIEFHAGGHRTLKPTTVFSWTQKNNSEIKQKLSIIKEKIITTENTYQFRWDTGAKISFDMTTEISADLEAALGVPLSVSVSMAMGMEAHLNIGETLKRKISKTEKWNVQYPTVIPPKSEITLTSYLTKGKMDVPFTAHFHKGEKRWTETGTYFGTQYFGFVTDIQQKNLS